MDVSHHLAVDLQASNDVNIVVADSAARMQQVGGHTRVQQASAIVAATIEI